MGSVLLFPKADYPKPPVKDVRDALVQVNQWMDMDAGLKGTLVGFYKRGSKHVEGLAEIIADAFAMDVRIAWGEPEVDGKVPIAACYIAGRLVELRDDLFDCEDFFICGVISHELCHVIAGVNEGRVREWQWRMYGDRPWFQAFRDEEAKQSDNKSRKSDG